MAISWGTEVRNSSGNGMRVGYEFSQSPSSVGAGTSSVTVTLKVYVWTRASVSDSTNTLSVSGNFSWSGDVSISHGGRGGTTLVRTLTRTVSPSYAGTVKSSASISLTGINAIPGTARASGSWNTQKRPISSPAKPSDMTVTRDSDTRQTMTWTRAASPASAPVQYQDIRRQDYRDQSWKTIATVSGTVSKYTDSSTRGNNQYRYAVRSRNSAGESSFTYSEYISTSPDAPTSVRAQKQGSDIKVSWVLPNTRVTGVEVWLIAAGEELPSSETIVLSGAPTSWTHPSPDPTKTWQYYVKAISGQDPDDVAPKLFSGGSTPSNVVQLLAAPAAPTRLNPSASAIDALDDQVFTWQHNSVDTTDQTAYQLRYRVNGGAWVDTGKTSSGAERHEFPTGTFDNGTSVEWQVRTWGDHADASPWSQLAVVSLSARPAATITSPASPDETTPIVDSSRLTAEWEYFDPEETTQIGARLRLEDANGSPVWSVTLNTAATTYPIPYTLSDGGTYTLVLAVRDSSGLWSYDTTQTFEVVYAKPPAPEVIVTWDLDLGGVVITIDHPEPGEGEAEASSADLQRSFNGGPWETVAAGLDPSTTITDFIPALDTVNNYRVISYSDLPSSIESQPVSVDTPSDGWVFVNGGPDWSYICRIRDHVNTSQTPRRSKTLNHFAGRAYPVETMGNQRTREISLSGRLGVDSSTSYEWEGLYDMGGPVCYREPAVVSTERSTRAFASFQDYQVSRQQVFQEVQMSFNQVEEV